MQEASALLETEARVREILVKVSETARSKIKGLMQNLEGLVQQTKNPENEN
jgi:hypothetical protein